MFISGSPISDYDDMSAPVDWTADTNQRKRGPWSNSKAHTSLSLSVLEPINKCRIAVGPRNLACNLATSWTQKHPFPFPGLGRTPSFYTPFGPSNEESSFCALLAPLGIFLRHSILG